VFCRLTGTVRSCDLLTQRFVLQYYTRGLQFVDEAAQTKIKKFFRREDAFSGFFLAILASLFRLSSHISSRVVSLVGSLVGNLLPRLMLREHGVPISSVQFGKTEANKPYINTVRFFL